MADRHTLICNTLQYSLQTRAVSDHYPVQVTVRGELASLCISSEQIIYDKLQQQNTTTAETTTITAAATTTTTIMTPSGKLNKSLLHNSFDHNICWLHEYIHNSLVYKHLLACI